METYRNALACLKSYYQERLKVLKAVPDGEAVARAYLVMNLPAANTYLGLSGSELDKAINLCGEDEDSREMKAYLSEQKQFISAFNGFTVTYSNVFNVMNQETALINSYSGRDDVVIQAMERWVEEAQQ